MSAGAPKDWEKQRLHSWRVHTGFHVHWDPEQSSDYIGSWAGPAYEFWRVLWGGRGWLWLTGHARTLVAEEPGNTDQRELSWRLPFWHQDLALPNSLHAPVLEHLRPNNQQDMNRDPPISRQAA